MDACVPATHSRFDGASRTNAGNASEKTNEPFAGIDYDASGVNAADDGGEMTAVRVHRDNSSSDHDGAVETLADPIKRYAARTQLHQLSCGHTAESLFHSPAPGAGFMNRCRLCQLTAAILTSDLTTHCGFHEATQQLSCNDTAPRWPNSMDARMAMT